MSTWARWQIPVNKGRKGIRNADQALTVRGEHADRIVGSPSWESSINYNRSMPEDLKLSQISSFQLLPPFRGLHSPRVRKHCQIIFACYFRKSSINCSFVCFSWHFNLKCMIFHDHWFQHPGHATTRRDLHSLKQDKIALKPHVAVDCTLPASLSGTFLQTLPDLVTPLKGHSSSLRSFPPTWSVPSKRSGY